MPRAPLILLVSLALLPALASPAPAAAWTAPERLSSPISFVFAPLLGYDADGRALAVWGFGSGIGNDSLTGTKSAQRRPGGSWARERTPAGRGLPVDLALSGRRALLLRTSARGARFRLTVEEWRSTGRVLRRSRLAAAPVVAHPRLAAAGGAAIATWVQRSPDGTSRVLASRRVRAGHWSAPEPLSAPGARVAAVALAGTRAVAAWQRGDRIEARGSASRGRHWGRVLTVGRLGVRPARADLSVALTPRGSVLLAWGAVRQTGDDAGPAAVRWALRPHGRGWRPARELERHAGDRARVAAAFDAAANGLLAWEGREAGRAVVRVRTLLGSAAGPAQTLSGPDPARLDDLAVAPGGPAAISWTEEGRRSTVRVAERAGGTRFGASALLSDSATDSLASRLAYHAGGRLTAVWRTALGGGHGEAVFAAHRRSRGSGA